MGLWSLWGSDPGPCCVTCWSLALHCTITTSLGLQFSVTRGCGDTSSIFIDVNAQRPVRWCIIRDGDEHGTFIRASRQRSPCLPLLVFIVCLRGAYPCTINRVSHQQTWLCLLFCCWLPPDIPVCYCTCCLLCLHSACAQLTEADVQMFS